MSSLFPELFKLLWHSSLPCVEGPFSPEQFMLKSCELAGQDVNCSQYFTKVPTDLGMCCALNLENSLKELKFTKMIEQMQETSEHVERRKVVAAKGMKNGLRLVLDLHSNQESFGSVENDFRAFHVYIGQPTEFPALQERSLIIEPGEEHFIDLTNQVFSSSGIKHLSPSNRHCHFRTEGNLEFYDEYTHTNCLLECGIKATEKELECAPWYLPHSPNSSICDPWKTLDFQKLLGKVDADASLCAHCLPDCEFTKTSGSLSSAKFRLKLLQSNPLISMFVRSCDSRNLNASPFCNLAKSSNPSAWAKDVNEVNDLHRKQA